MEDKDGNTRYNTEVLADNMTMLGSRNSSTELNSNVDNSNNSSEKLLNSNELDNSDDLPF